MANIDEVASKFDKAIILTAPDKVLRERLSERENNHFGSEASEQNSILEHKQYIHSALDDYQEVDTAKSVSEVADNVLQIVEE